MNPPLKKLKGQALHWAKKSLALDLDEADEADEDTLNRILWHATRGDETPYPRGVCGCEGQTASGLCVKRCQDPLAGMNADPMNGLVSAKKGLTRFLRTLYTASNCATMAVMLSRPPRRWTPQPGARRQSSARRPSREWRRSAHHPACRSGHPSKARSRHRSGSPPQHIDLNAGLIAAEHVGDHVPETVVLTSSGRMPRGGPVLRPRYDRTVSRRS